MKKFWKRFLREDHCGKTYKEKLKLIDRSYSQKPMVAMTNPETDS